MAPWLRPEDREALTKQTRSSEFQRKIGETLMTLYSQVSAPPTIRDAHVAKQKHQQFTRALRAVVETASGGLGMSAPFQHHDDLLDPMHTQMMSNRVISNSRVKHGTGGPRAAFADSTDREIWRRRDGVREGHIQRATAPNASIDQGDSTTVRDQETTRKTKGSKALDLTNHFRGSDFTGMQSAKRNTRMDSTLTRSQGTELLL